MTSEVFRSSSERVGRMRELLSDPTLAAAIVCLQDETPKWDAADSADAVASVRLLSRRFGHEQAINILLSLAEPIPADEPQEKETWGVKMSEFKPS